MLLNNVNNMGGKSSTFSTGVKPCLTMLLTTFLMSDHNVKQYSKTMGNGE